jgi:hypothetical protein
VVMILFATLASPFTAEAFDCCQPHDCAAVHLAGDMVDDCHSGSDPAQSDCPDCCLHHSHLSAGILSLKISAPMFFGADKMVLADALMDGRDPARLLRPPQSV